MGPDVLMFPIPSLLALSQFSTLMGSFPAWSQDDSAQHRSGRDGTRAPERGLHGAGKKASQPSKQHGHIFPGSFYKEFGKTWLFLPKIAQSPNYKT